MATQADIDALTEKLTGLRSALDSGNARIQQEIEHLRSQNVDVSGLEAAVSELSSEVDEAVNLVPAPDNGGGETPGEEPGTEPEDPSLP